MPPSSSSGRITPNAECWKSSTKNTAKARSKTSALCSTISCTVPNTVMVTAMVMATVMAMGTPTTATPKDTAIIRGLFQTLRKCGGRRCGILSENGVGLGFMVCSLWFKVVVYCLWFGVCCLLSCENGLL